jgi:PTH1 family peptidyl-tRNA hydrolase
MNISGAGVATAWKQFLKDTPSGHVKLVVVHDELELRLGAINTKSGAASAKGHNGLKSINEKIGSTPYMRIGIGIGRPLGREPGVVSEYVLRKMIGKERSMIEGTVAKVEGELIKLSEG